MKCFSTLMLLLAMFAAGCAPRASQPQTLSVFAAASLTDAFAEIGKNFESQNPNTLVAFNFGGSQTLRTQIEEGAAADVFASANLKEMDALVSSAFITPDSPQIFLNNKLTLILPKDNPAAIHSLADLTNANIKIVLAAEEVPVGKYAREALSKMNVSFGADFKDKVLANVASNEDNVKQVVAKVQLGEADAGIVYTSDALAAPGLQTIAIPDEMNVVAQYPIAPLSQSKNAKLAQAFTAYVLSPDGQAILKKWGFSPAP